MYPMLHSRSLHKPPKLLSHIGEYDICIPSLSYYIMYKKPRWINNYFDKQLFLNIQTRFCTQCSDLLYCSITVSIYILYIQATKYSYSSYEYTWFVVYARLYLRFSISILS